MSLAGCSLPFFSSKQTPEPVSQEKKIPALTEIVKTVQANLFEDEEAITTEAEPQLEEQESNEPGELLTLTLEEDFVEDVIFVDPDVLPEPEFLTEDLIEELPEIEVTDEEIIPFEELPTENLAKLIPEATLALALEEPEIMSPKKEIPQGALPSTGAVSPLSNLWGWVKSWF